MVLPPSTSPLSTVNCAQVKAPSRPTEPPLLSTVPVLKSSTRPTSPIGEHGQLEALGGGWPAGHEGPEDACQRCVADAGDCWQQHLAKEFLSFF